MIYICAAASALVLAGIGIIAPRRLLVRIGAAFAVAGLLASGYFAFADLLSRPKPVRLAWAEDAAEEAVVLGSALQEGKAIYLWLALPEKEEPRAYRLPWSTAKAEQLEEARRRAEEPGNTGTVKVRRPFEGETSEEVPEQMFYAPAQPTPPPKPVEPG